ncbi:hypothetical protein DSO57_1013426 [Entomophthora muscae]|uniref:Uncharacterized protein n=3 Tax=Entomophthora muscae TaxID=34485 RepID=A0ACC2TTA0_9FUNG|nr:hypothetical protein DSO57_1013426 [Entomophthora muscae]
MTLLPIKRKRVRKSRQKINLANRQEAHQTELTIPSAPETCIKIEHDKPYARDSIIGLPCPERCTTTFLQHETVTLFISELVCSIKRPQKKQASKRSILYILPSICEVNNAFRCLTTKKGSVAVLTNKMLELPSLYDDLRHFQSSKDVILMTAPIFAKALTHRRLHAGTISSIFARKETLLELYILVYNVRTFGCIFSRVYVIPDTHGVAADCRLVSLKAGDGIATVHASHSALLDTFKCKRFILNMQKNGLKLQNELGLWASELYFSHALNRLAELVENNITLSLVDAPLSDSLLEPCLQAASAVSELHPGSKNRGISKKVETLLNLLKCQLPRGAFQGVILTGCPLVAIYLERVLGCLYPRHDTATEVAVPRPQGYIGPLPSIEEAFASYSSGDVQVLITTFDFISKLKDKVASQVVLFNASLSAWSYMDLKLRLPSVRSYYVFKGDEGSTEIIKFHRKFGTIISGLELQCQEDYTGLPIDSFMASLPSSTYLLPEKIST